MTKRVSLKEELKGNGEIGKSKNDFSKIDKISKEMHKSTPKENTIEIEYKVIALKVSSRLHRELKVKLAGRGQTIRDYVSILIQKDLGIEE